MQRHLLVITGPRGSGKSTIAERLRRETGWPLLEYSRTLRQLRHQMGLDRLRLRSFVGKLRRERGPDFGICCLANEFGKHGRVIITGIRHAAEIAVLRALPDTTVSLLYVDAPFFVRLQRIRCARTEHTGLLEFIIEDWTRGRAGLPSMKRGSLIVKNVADLESAMSAVRQLLQML